MNFLLAILLLCSPQEHETKHYQLRAEGIEHGHFRAAYGIHHGIGN